MRKGVVYVRKLCGVYLVRASTGECYVGASNHCKERWKNHRFDMRHGKHSFRVMEIVARLGLGAFEFSMLEECEPERLVEREQHWLDKLKPTLNAVPLAGKVGRPGIKHLESSKIKMSVVKKGKPRPAHVGLAVAAANRARSPEANAKMVEARRRNQAAKR